jgi:dihydroneopterin triphosphate diphosphatase
MTLPSPVPVRCAAVAAVVLRTGSQGAQVLLLRRTGGLLDGVWSNVTGRIEAGETAWQAAAREIREEADLVPTALYSAGFTEQFYNIVANCIEVVPVFVGLVAADRAVTINAENSDHRWVSFDEAVALVPFAGHRAALRHIRSAFVDAAPGEWLRIADYRP